jgi:hypothetical protein
LDSNGYATRALNPNLRIGDPIAIICTRCGSYPHAVFATGFDSQGRLTIHQRNSNRADLLYSFNSFNHTSNSFAYPNHPIANGCRYEAHVIYMNALPQRRTPTFWFNATSLTINDNSVIGKLISPSPNATATGDISLISVHPANSNLHMFWHFTFDGQNIHYVSLDVSYRGPMPNAQNPAAIRSTHTVTMQRQGVEASFTVNIDIPAFVAPTFNLGRTTFDIVNSNIHMATSSGTATGNITIGALSPPNPNISVTQAANGISLSVRYTGALPTNANPFPITSNHTVTVTRQGVSRTVNINVDIPGQIITDPQAINNINSFITRLYQNILMRAPDEGGFNNWQNQLINRRATGSDVAASMLFSNEFIRRNASNTDFINALYRACFGREPDASGRAFWVGQLNMGVPREIVFQSLINSNEFGRVCAAMTVERGTYVPSQEVMTRMFVVRLYNICLNRAPDIQGLNNWTNQLRAGTSTGSQAARGFFQSNEFTRRNLSNAQFVDTLYIAILDRQPDSAGRANWINRLNTGTSRNDVLNSFLSSNEFNRLCQSYGIRR